jgi:polyisoprenoid-binding protein YceI
VASWLGMPPAAAQTIKLAPPETTVAYTVYALGLLPLQASFTDFSGGVQLDPANPAACKIDVTVQVASLRMDDPTRQRQALGAIMLDAQHFPLVHFVGACAGPGVTGTLTMHGVSHPLAMTMRHVRDRLVCTGIIRRGDYGINGLPGLVGARVKLSLSTNDPAGFDGFRYAQSAKN